MIYLLIFISGVAKAIIDTLQFHYDSSVFSGLNSSFWNPNVSWVNQHKTWLPAFTTDGWHLFQSIFLTTLFASIVLYKPIFNYHEIDAIRMIADFIILRGVFGFGFVLFYNKLLLK